MTRLGERLRLEVLEGQSFGGDFDAVLDHLAARDTQVMLLEVDTGTAGRLQRRGARLISCPPPVAVQAVAGDPGACAVRSAALCPGAHASRTTPAPPAARLFSATARGATLQGMVKACLNGARTREEHSAVPQSPAELGADALAARQAGAFAVHVHPRDASGRQTLQASACDAAVNAIRAAAPGLPVGLSTSQAIDPDPFARAAALSSWRQAPDFVSVNLWELGWAGIVRAALHAGIAVEAGLATAADARELVRSPFTHQVLRALVEVDGGPEEAHAIAEALPEHIEQLWHGYGERTWEILPAAAASGHDVRIGLEDVLVLPDGRPASGNAELVAAAVELTSG